jgi:hypothetical protein
MEGERFPHDMMHFSPCVYSDYEGPPDSEWSENVVALSKNAQHFAHLALSRRVNQEDQATLRRENLGPFVYCCSRYKHRGFKEENEVRLVVIPAPLQAVRDGIKSIGRQFRHKNGECIPYVSVFDSTGIMSAIKAIIVGPHKEKEARAAALRIMLGAEPIDVSCSDIPFVGRGFRVQGSVDTPE